MTQPTLPQTWLPRLSPVQASFVTGLSPATINATIDRGEVRNVAPPHASTPARQLGWAELVYLYLRGAGLNQVLSRAARLQLYEALQHTFNETPGWTLLQATSEVAERLAERVHIVDPEPVAQVNLGALRIGYGRALQICAERLTQLHNAEQFVVSDPEIRGGEPVVRGTRVPVYRLAELADQGVAESEIVEAHPTVTPEGLRAALVYAFTHPRRGRPPRAPWHANRGEVVRHAPKFPKPAGLKPAGTKRSGTKRSGSKRSGSKQAATKRRAPKKRTVASTARTR